MNMLFRRNLFNVFKLQRRLLWSSSDKEFFANVPRLADVSKFDAKLVESHYFERPKDLKITNEDGYFNDGFTMVLPPPNVTGNLHVGHALTVVVEDSICRFNKLLGNYVRWIPGFDHAGIATQTVVEKQILRKFGKKREEMSNGEFLDYCENWKNERITDITKQLKSLGCSLDWEYLFYTMDENFSNAVKTAFVRLYDLGLITRETRLVQSFNENEPTMKEQWFLKMTEMNRELLKDVEEESGKLNFDPATVKGNLIEFLKFEEPWCLSRQLVWGHKIPAYFVESSKRWIVALTEEDARKQLLPSEKDSKLIQDSDVLDTWFSSSLIPIIIAGWPKKSIKSASIDLMETGHDIIGFWVARMLVICKRLTGHYPFSNVLIHGLIRDSQNRKMSKSLGNVVDPMDIINGITLEQMIERMKSSNLPLEDMEASEKDLKKCFPNGIKACGADALRFAMLRHDATDFEIHIDIPRFADEGRRFCNKIWNMCKYYEKVRKLYDEQDVAPREGFEGKGEEDDAKINEKLYQTVQLYYYCMSKNRPHLAFHHLYLFILVDVCDNYLESTKQAVWAKDPERIGGIYLTFKDIICISLTLLQTFMPFVSTFLLDSLRFHNDGLYECYDLLVGHWYYCGYHLDWVNDDALPELTDEEYQEITKSLIGKDKREKTTTEGSKRR
uniref:valine--tRNA ligase n=1 Tax=Meloidogyne incognita TaxID=6306 RepID=A0A914L9K9_MELIC